MSIMAESPNDRLSQIVKRIFGIPGSYVMPIQEEEKLLNILEEATSVMEARMIRTLDCSAYCVEKYCYFCSNA